MYNSSFVTRTQPASVAVELFALWLFRYPLLVFARVCVSADVPCKQLTPQWRVCSRDLHIPETILMTCIFLWLFQRVAYFCERSKNSYSCDCSSDDHLISLWAFQVIPVMFFYERLKGVLLIVLLIRGFLGKEYEVTESGWSTLILCLLQQLETKSSSEFEALTRQSHSVHKDPPRVTSMDQRVPHSTQHNKNKKTINVRVLSADYSQVDMHL